MLFGPMLFRVALSAVTLFGGHVLNRRPERVLQVFALLAVLGILYSMLPTLLLQTSALHEMPRAFNVFSLSLFGSALLSAALTWKDARSPETPPPLSLVSRAAGSVVSLFGLFLLGFATLIFIQSHNFTGQTTSPAAFTSLSSPYAIANLGGPIRHDDLKPVPVGPHPLRGRIMTAGKPVADVRVELILNGAFRAHHISTNRQGEFEIKLPAGPWSINEVSVIDWNRELPEGRELLLFSEYESRLTAGYYSRQRPDESPLRLELPQREGAELPTFELRHSIDVRWPPNSQNSISEPSDAPIADVATDVIRWEPIAGATEYEIQMQSVERKANATSMRMHLLRRQSGTDLPLASLPQVPRISAEPSEYSLLIYAFDGDGRLLSHSTKGLSHYAFRLAGDTDLAKEPIPYAPVEQENARYIQDVERLSLVHGLLEYKQIDAAQAILAEVSDAAPPGRKAAMQGAIEAMRGNCAAAVPLLDQAEKEGGFGCVPDKYRAMCPK